MNNCYYNLCYGLLFDMNSPDKPWVKAGFGEYDVEEWLCSLQSASDIDVVRANDLMSHENYVIFSLKDDVYRGMDRYGWEDVGMLKEINITADADDRLKEFCLQSGLAYSQPKLYITTYWG